MGLGRGSGEEDQIIQTPKEDPGGPPTVKKRTPGVISAKRVPPTPPKAEKPRISREKPKTGPAKPRVRKGREKTLIAPGKAPATRPALPEPYASGLVPADPAGQLGDVVHAFPIGEAEARPSRATVGPDRVAAELRDEPEGKVLFVRDTKTSALYDEWASRRLEIADALTLDLLRGLVGKTFTREVCDQVRDRCRKAIFVATGLASVALGEIERAAKAFKVAGPQDPNRDKEIFEAIEATGEGVRKGSETVAEAGTWAPLTSGGLRKAYYRHLKSLPDLKVGN